MKTFNAIAIRTGGIRYGAVFLLASEASAYSDGIDLPGLMTAAVATGKLG